jgi:putative peptidoglycan lipid II flippase
VLASLLPHGSLSYLYYADRLVQFPLGVFAIAVGTVALPAMSRHAAHHDLDALRETVSYAFRQISLIMIPATVSLIVLAEPIMGVLFQRGRFDPSATKMSAEALIGYSIGLWFIAQIRIVAPAFYALKDTMTPMKIATLTIAINLLLSLWLMRPLGHAGLALAVSLSSIFQLGVLMWKLSPRLQGFDWWELLQAWPKVLAAASGTGLLCWAIAAQIDWLTAPFSRRVAVLGSAVVAGGLFYCAALYILRVREVKDLLASFLVRLR